MGIVIVKRPLTEEEFKEARKDYQSYIKITIDLEGETAAVGGEYHADAEKILLEQGSKQKNIWGGGFNLETRQFETNAIINLRIPENDSCDILDPFKREKFLKIAKKIFKNYV